ncbi:sensor histidine kinase [Ekhidna sp.]|uniref:sensor histidine kinase n=1 Tax=Ekhidna sp. TaxID=2608089 RepID=UPI003CCC0981
MRHKSLFIFFVLLIGISQSALGQNQTIVLDTSMFHSHQRLFLAPLEGWLFKQGHDSEWAQKDLNTSSWQSFRPNQLTAEIEDTSGRVEGWFRINIKLDESFDGMPLSISRDLWAATDIYIDGELFYSFGDTGNPYRPYNPVLKHPKPINLETGKAYLLAIHFVDYESTLLQRELRLKPDNLKNLLAITGPAYIDYVDRHSKSSYIFGSLSIGLSALLFFLFWFLYFLNKNQTLFKLIAWLITFVLLTSIAIFYNSFFEISYAVEKIRFLFLINLQAITTILGLFILEWMLTQKNSLWSKVIFCVLLITNTPAHLFSISLPFGIAFSFMLAYYGSLLYKHWKSIKGAQWMVVIGVIASTLATLQYISIHKYLLDFYNEFDKPIISLANLITPLFLLGYVSARLNESLKEVYEESQKVLKVNEEKRELLANQNVLLEQQVSERTSELNQSIEDLKSTQNQLIHSEKMASLGELTAGIAHEIQNPLNFVNNFSELNKELIDELKDAVAKNEQKEVQAILKDLLENESKIAHHGKRAEEIVKSMLQHSRSGNGEKELTDINQLADEYLRLAYHGLRAKDKSFNADFKTELDPSLPKINVIPQDIGRVLLNLINNAFQAVSTRNRELTPQPTQGGVEYQPQVTVKTMRADTPSGAGGSASAIQIIVSDNGMGIPEEIKDKIFQPFFTTKATGEGTGLGLSMSYDIVTKGHGGTIEVESVENKGSTFIVILPIK